MAFEITAAVSQEDVASYFIKKLDTALVAKYAMRYHIASQGADSFKIPGFDDATTGVYTGLDITIEDQTMSEAILLLDQKPYFAIQVDKVDTYENAVNIVTGALDRGAYAVQKVIDAFVFNVLATEADIPEIPTVVVDADNVIKTILNLGLQLDDNDVAEWGRVLFVPPFFATALAEANITLNTGSAEEATRRGWVGIFGGFQIYKTNQLTDGVETGSKVVIAGIPDGGDFAQSLKTASTVAMEKNFKDLVKGLNSNGAVVSEPNCYVKLDAQSVVV